MFADLHCHSTFSDGSATVEEIIIYAKRTGVDCIALTDHDTIAGIEQANFYGEKHGVKIINGVECSCRDKSRKRSAHILCYQPKDMKVLERYLDVTLKTRTAQKFKAIEKVKKLYPITLEDVLKFKGESQSIYECHIMQAVANMGLSESICGDIQSSLFSYSGSCYEPIDYFDIYEILQIIDEAGGVPVFAHPEEYDSFDIINELAEKRLIKGIEVYHPRNSEGARKRLLSTAEEYGLIVTGGSDFHGFFKKHPTPIGYCKTDKQNIERILNTK